MNTCDPSPSPCTLRSRSIISTQDGPDHWRYRGVPDCQILPDQEIIILVGLEKSGTIAIATKNQGEFVDRAITDSVCTAVNVVLGVEVEKIEGVTSFDARKFRRSSVVKMACGRIESEDSITVVKTASTLSRNIIGFIG